MIGNQEGYFKIVETNQFKALTHLSLKFHAATDDVLKRYLSYRLTKERKSNEELKYQNQNLSESLNNTQDVNKKLKETLKMVTNDREKAIQEILLDEKSKINQLKEETIRRE